MTEREREREASQSYRTITGLRRNLLITSYICRSRRPRVRTYIGWKLTSNKTKQKKPSENWRTEATPPSAGFSLFVLPIRPFWWNEVPIQIKFGLPWKVCCVRNHPTLEGRIYNSGHWMAQNEGQHTKIQSFRTRVVVAHFASFVCRRAHFFSSFFLILPLLCQV